MFRHFGSSSFSWPEMVHIRPKLAMIMEAARTGHDHDTAWRESASLITTRHCAYRCSRVRTPRSATPLFGGWVPLPSVPTGWRAPIHGVMPPLASASCQGVAGPLRRKRVAGTGEPAGRLGSDRDAGGEEPGHGPCLRAVRFPGRDRPVPAGAAAACGSVAAPPRYPPRARRSTPPPSWRTWPRRHTGCSRDDKDCPGHAGRGRWRRTV